MLVGAGGAVGVGEGRGCTAGAAASGLSGGRLPCRRTRGQGGGQQGLGR